jgi:hypothetical protein
MGNARSLVQALHGASLDKADLDVWGTQGTTNSVVLRRAGAEVDGAHVIGIVREGPDPGWAPALANQYRLTFVVPTRALGPGEPLEVLLRWHDKRRPLD